MSLLDRVIETVRMAITIDKGRYFRAVFLPVDGTLSLESERVLAHLRIYCRAEGTTYHPEPHEHARREGRREVWLEIQRYLQLDDAQVRRLTTVEEDHE